MIPLKDAHQKFIDHLKEKNRAHATVLAYGKDLDQLVEFLKELEKAHVAEISKDDIDAFMAKLLKKERKKDSVIVDRVVRVRHTVSKTDDFAKDNPELIVKLDPVEDRTIKVIK